MDLSIRDAAEALKVSESTIARWIAEGLPAAIINGRYRFNRVDLLEWARNRKLPAAGLFVAGKEPVPVLSALLEGHIHYDVPGADVRSAMAAVAERLPLPGARDRAIAAQILAERETAGSTAIGDGIAIPHARSPLVFSLERPLLALCFLATPVDFRAPDGRPVHAVLAIVSPTVRGHLALLARLASALHDSRFKALLQERGAAADIVACLKELE